MEFKKYQHIERIGKPAVHGLEDGICYIFPKIDGTNSSVYASDITDSISAGSRTRELGLEKHCDNAGFLNWARQNDNIKRFLVDYPNLRLFGEWLVPHTIKDYADSAWHKFYVFDVMSEKDVHLHYNFYAPLLKSYGIEYLKPLAILDHPTPQQLVDIMNSNTFLMKDGYIGEGIVVKRYDFTSKYGRTVWGKMVRSEFQLEHKKVFGEGKAKELIEEKIVNHYVTEAFVRKEYNKMLNSGGGSVVQVWEMNMTPQLLGRMFYSLVSEESWNFVKENNKPIIDFKRLMFYCSEKTKSYLPEHFPRKPIAQKPLIICIIGESGSGKSLITQHINKKYGIGLIQSYTERAKRESEIKMEQDGEKLDHTFISADEFDAIKPEDMIAFTNFGEYRYCCTKSDVSDLNLYIINESGLTMLREKHAKDYDIVSIRISCDRSIRAQRSGVTEERLNRDDGEFTMGIELFDYVISSETDIDDTIKQADDTILKILKNKKR